MKEKKGILIWGSIILAAVILLALWWMRPFDAKTYVKAVLDHNLKGKVTTVSKFAKDQSEEALLQQYEESVRSFAENNIISGIEMEEELKEQYVELCKEIFKSMKYHVKEEERISRTEYEVLVEYQPTNVFQKFSEAVPGELERILEKVDKGEYKGTEEEINIQMREEFVVNCYSLLEKTFQEAEYGETKTALLKVQKNSDSLFVIDDGQIELFVKKIMGFDTNQD